MNESNSPVTIGRPASDRFVRFVAGLSVIAPLLAVLICVLFGFLAVSGGATVTPVEMIIVGLTSMLSILCGFVSGILARDAVLQYLALCRKFWGMDYGKLDQWSNEVKAGEIPDFGANLIY